jgi:GrpB-like predicted nucleotidyltransferase (UPF0157 family)
MRSVWLAPYDPNWPSNAARLAASFAAALGDDPRLIAIHHIGSTAVPGLTAKPILDLLPEVSDLTCFDDARDALVAAGYQWRGENGISSRRYFTRSGPDGARLAHLHGFATGHRAIGEHLALRDYLCAHPEIAREYAARKAECAAAHPDDSAAYSARKTPFVERIVADAMRWAARVAPPPAPPCWRPDPR